MDITPSPRLHRRPLVPRAPAARLIVALITLLMAMPAAAQDRLADAKAQYDAAAYQQALASLDRMGPDASTLEARQYRVLCLIALGRADAAVREIRAILADDPAFSPDPAEVAPSVASLYTATRGTRLSHLAGRRNREAGPSMAVALARPR